MNKGRCKWCDKSILRGNYCGYGLHRKLYENFRAGFESEMFEIKNKPKVSETEAYKKVINLLTNTS